MTPDRLLVATLKGQAKTQRTHSERAVRAHGAYPDDNDHIDAARLMERAADRIANLEAALATAHEVFAAEIEDLHKIILMNQPDYKRTIAASVDGA